MTSIVTTVFRRDNIHDANEYIEGVDSNTIIKDMIKYKTIEPSVNSVVSLLGITTRKPCIGFTIALPKNGLIPTRIPRTLKSGRVVSDTATLAYGGMTTAQQLNFLINDYIPHVVTPFIHAGVICPEYHKDGTIHMHIMGQDDDIKDELDMRDLRCNVNQCLAVRKLTKKGTPPSVMNHVHFLKDAPDWLRYIQKDRERMNNKGIPFYCFKHSISI